MSLKQIENFVKLANDKVAKNVTIVSNKDLGQDFFLHISPDNMSKIKYIPWIGPSQAKSEDRTIPRITVSDTIAGCIIGYGRLYDDVYYSNPNELKERNYKNGFYIHKIEFEHALKPTPKLVYDAKESNEHWLVTYSEDTKEYKGKVVGKMFVTEYIAKPRTNDFNLITIKTLIEVLDKDGFKYTENNFLTKGYWEVKKTFTPDNDKHNKETKLEVKEITADEYLKAKDISAAMLSINDKVPTYAKW